VGGDGHHRPRFYTIPGVYSMQVVTLEDREKGIDAVYEFILTDSFEAPTVLFQGILQGFATNGTAGPTEVLGAQSRGCSQAAVDRATEHSPGFQVNAWMGAPPPSKATFQCFFGADAPQSGVDVLAGYPMPNYTCTYYSPEGYISVIGSGKIARASGEPAFAGQPCAKMAAQYNVGESVVLELNRMQTDCFWGAAVDSGPGTSRSFNGSVSTGCDTMWSDADADWDRYSKDASMVKVGLSCKKAWESKCDDGWNLSVFCPGNPAYESDDPANKVHTQCSDGMAANNGPGPPVATPTDGDVDDCYSAVMRRRGWVERNSVYYSPISSCLGFTQNTFTFRENGDFADIRYVEGVVDGQNFKYLLDRDDDPNERLSLLNDRIRVPEDAPLLSYGYADIQHVSVGVPAIDFIGGDVCNATTKQRWSARMHFVNTSYIGVDSSDPQWEIVESNTDEVACMLHVKLATHLCDAQ
jgi:hypothetical protein